MMNNMMEYKGYHTKIEFDAESMTLRGKIEGINDYVDFEAGDISSIEVEFHSAVDDYLEFCKEVEDQHPAVEATGRGCGSVGCGTRPDRQFRKSAYKV